MAERIVVSFHGPSGPEAGSGSGYLERSLSIRKRAEAHGGALCAWSGEAFSVDFAAEALDEALGFTLEQVAEAQDTEPLRIGIAQGEMQALGTPEGLAWGKALLRAERLAAIARPGDVLLDPDLAAVQSGDLVTAGLRRGRAADGSIVRGLRLDIYAPLRGDTLANVHKLVAAPELVGREEELGKLSVPLGCAGLLRAAPGAGGTRLLQELVHRLAPPRSLRIAPTFLPREPLGALRNAFARSLAREAPPELPEALAAALDKLLAGEGISTRNAAELVDAWLAPVDGRSGLLTVDDVTLIDLATLEVVSQAIPPPGFFRSVVRIDVEETLPEVLSSIPVAAEVTLGPLPKKAAVELARAFCGGAITQEAAERWARRGQGMPLGIREALAEGLSTGELRWVGDVAEPRDRTSGRGASAPAHEWITRRATWLEPGERAALVGVALLGADAPNEIVDAVSTLMAGAGARVAVVEDALCGAGWAYRPEEGWLAIASRTTTRALIGLLDAGTRELWHRMAGRVLEQNVGPLGLAEPAYHAAVAGERASAAVLAAEAALAAAGAGLRKAAAALIDEARSLDPDVQVPELSDEGELLVDPRAEEISIASLIEAAMGEGGQIRSEPHPPSSIGSLSPDSLGAESAGVAAFGSPGKASVADAVAALGADPDAVEDPVVMAERLSKLLRQALVEGDVETLEDILVRLRVTGEHDALVERMSAFVQLVRGEPGEGLRKLKEAVAGASSPRAHARALLSYGIALASAGDVDRALLETLTALARAREASDRQAEQASARFLAYLSAAMGQPQAASVWARVAQTPGEALRG
ncbi:hypothetical protein [Polyangium jinanense]|uniref:Uncharacterized protein n=1 Tax=Polyangium jinanense TaxID=2829994 RepID=A0A9X3X673_9BACT|nr:hypothetical protein [Polyangium jinanense]MDC3958624.1 hypothetical protein [Polyangium jinanense]MDC3983068.1 hypothetical protein [Polyangium jinanense]